MGYWQENENKRRLWYDPVDGSWKRDRSKWVPTKKQTTFTEQVFPAQLQPWSPPQMEINTVFGSTIKGYYERQACINIYSNGDYAPGDTVLETNAYNMVIPIKAGYANFENPELRNYVLQPNWKIKSDTDPNIQYQIYSSFEDARARAASVPYYALYINPSQYVPLGHQTNVNDWQPNDPNGLVDRFQWSDGPVLVVNWEELNANTPVGNNQFGVIEVTNTFIDPVTSQQYPLSARFPFCLFPNGTPAPPIQDLNDKDVFLWNYRGNPDPTDVDITELVQDSDGTLFEFPNENNPKQCTETTYETTFTINTADSDNGIWHQWGYRQDFVEVYTEQIIKQVYGDFGGNENQLLSETILRNFDKDSQLNAGNNIHTWGPGEKYVIYTHIYDVFNTTGGQACKVYKVRYNRDTTPPFAYQTLSACWNDFQNYGGPAPSDYSAFTITNYASVYLWCPETPPDPANSSVDARNSSTDANILYIAPDESAIYLHQKDGDHFVQLPMFGQDGSTDYTFQYQGGKYSRFGRNENLSGSPRTLTYSVCQDNWPGDPGGVISQHNVTQFGPTSTRNLFNDFNIIQNIKGLFYVRFNYQAFPNAGTASSGTPLLADHFVQQFDAMQTRLPVGWGIRKLGNDEITWKPGNAATGNFAVGQTLGANSETLYETNMVLSDMAPGDFGRSLKLIISYGIRLEDTPGSDTFTNYIFPSFLDGPGTTPTNTGVTGRYRAMISIRQFYDYNTQTLRLRFKAPLTLQANAYGIVYLSTNPTP